MRKYRAQLVLLIVLLLAFLRPLSASADLVIVGEVVAVLKGDTMKVLWTGGIEMVRLADVDCPDKRQPLGKEAKWFTEDHTISRTVIITIKDTDTSGRSVSEVFLDTGESLNQALVKNGLARWNQKYLEGSLFSKLENEARGKKIGLWGD
ncbi:MAG: thermonuclease family protein [Nitrospiria bacterium]